ncbi:MAG: OmpW family protein [Gammaproteobacteria bacterium]
MITQFFSKALFTFLCLLIFSSTVNANDNDRWIVRVRAINISPDDQSRDIAVNGTPVANSGVGVDEDIVPELDITYMLTKHIGLELILATSSHNVTARGSLGSLGKVINTGVLPPTLTLQYHFNPTGKIRPYAGIGVNYTHFYDEKVRGPLDVPGADIRLDSSWGFAAQLGMDYMLNNEWFINADIKYIQIDSTASFHDTVFGNVEVDVDIDPIVVGFGFGKRF